MFHATMAKICGKISNSENYDHSHHSFRAHIVHFTIHESGIPKIVGFTAPYREVLVIPNCPRTRGMVQ